MPKVTSSAKAHTSTIPDQEIDVPSSHEESASSDHESENEISFHPSRQQAPNPVMQNMLYHQFLKWQLKCEDILKCELVALSEPQQCKKVIAWSGDFGMDQYVSQGLTKEELKLDTIWT